MPLPLGHTPSLSPRATITTLKWVEFFFFLSVSLYGYKYQFLNKIICPYYCFKVRLRFNISKHWAHVSNRKLVLSDQLEVGWIELRTDLELHSSMWTLTNITLAFIFKVFVCLKERERSSSTGSLPKWLQWLRLSQAGARSFSHCPGTLATIHCLSRCIRSELEHKWNS